MDLSLLTAISPIDGRYRSKTEPLAEYFSEYALIRYRVRVEIEYFIALCELPLPQLQGINHSTFDQLRDIYRNFTPANAQRVKDIESITNHDVKAVEYFIKEQLDAMGGFESYKEFIHFGLTSQDINNTSVPLSIKEALEQVYYPMVEELIEQLHDYAEQWKNIPMLAKTHGQPASPTRLGKEVMVYVYRLEEQLRGLKATPITAKFGGATGNYNAHHVAYPQYDWREFGNTFVSEKLGLEREQYTTQISNYDWLGAIFDAMRRINTIVIDLDRDFWMYISMDYFKQKIKKGEVGSSAMPHKVNPIDYENSEGNLGIANAILQFLAAKLPVSRLQRDLTDSTVLRNVGVPMGHAVIAFQSTLKGLRKLILNEEKLQEDLDNTWAVVAEAIQTILRREAYPNPYETLKALTRTNEKLTGEKIKNFIETLEVSEDVKEELRAITPSKLVTFLKNNKSWISKTTRKNRKRLHRTDIRRSIVQVVHHVHAFIPLRAQYMSVPAIAITTTKASSAQRDSAQVCRAMHLSVLREAIAHVTTTITMVATASSVRVVTASAHRVATVVLSRAVTVVLSRAVTASVHRVAVMASVLSRVATVVLSRVVTVVPSRVATVVLSRVATVVLSRVAMASLTEQLLIRRVHVSAQPTTIQMQSTL